MSNTLLNSPPEAYSSVYVPGIRHTEYANDAKMGESPDAVQQRLHDTFSGAFQGEFGRDKQEFIAAEIDVLGLDPKCDADTFWAAHRTFLEGYDSLFGETLHESADIVMKSLAQDLVDDHMSEADIMAILESRLQNVWTGVYDPWAFPSDPLHKETLASHNYATKGILINMPAVIMGLKSGEMTEDDVLSSLNQLMRHELQHAVAAIWFDSEDTTVPRKSSGIGIGKRGEGADWVDESTIEKYRKNKMGDEKFGFRYQLGVATLEIADSIEPDFEKMRLSTRIFNTNRGAMIGELEKIFGPLAHENIGALIEKSQELKDIPEFKHDLLALLSEDNHNSANKLIDEVILKIYQQAGANESLYKKHTDTYRTKMALKAALATEAPIYYNNGVTN